MHKSLFHSSLQSSFRLSSTHDEVPPRMASHLIGVSLSLVAILFLSRAIVLSRSPSSASALPHRHAVRVASEQRERKRGRGSRRGRVARSAGGSSSSRAAIRSGGSIRSSATAAAPILPHRVHSAQRRQRRRVVLVALVLVERLGGQQRLLVGRGVGVAAGRAGRAGGRGGRRHPQAEGQNVQQNAASRAIACQRRRAQHAGSVARHREHTKGGAAALRTITRPCIRRHSPRAARC